MGTQGPLAVERVDLLDGAQVLSVGAFAPAFDGPCATELTGTVSESDSTVAVRVSAFSTAGGECPVDLRHVTIPLDDVLGQRSVVDASSGRPIAPGGPFPQGEHPGDPSLPFERVRISADGKVLTMHFLGAPDDSGPCGVRYTGAARESSSRVEVRVHGEPTGDDPLRTCPDLAGPRQVTVPLSRPLGERPLYDNTGRLLNPSE